MPVPEFLCALRNHVGHGLLFLPGVSGLTFNERNEVLLGRRTDNGRWAVIGGVMEPGGETPAQAVVREVLEETGVTVAVERVSGVYTLPEITYPNGDVTQYVSIAFRCRPIFGTPHAADDESSEVRYFALDALPPDLSAVQRQRIADAAQPGAHLPAVFG